MSVQRVEEDNNADRRMSGGSTAFAFEHSSEISANMQEVVDDILDLQWSGGRHQDTLFYHAMLEGDIYTIQTAVEILEKRNHDKTGHTGANIKY